MTKTSVDDDVRLIPTPKELLERVSNACGAQSLDDIHAVLIIMASRVLVSGVDNMEDLYRDILAFATSVYDTTIELAEKLGVGEPRQ